MKDALSKIASTPNRRASDQSGNSPAHAEITSRYLLQALEHARVLFWLGVAAGSVATLLQVYIVIASHMQGYTELQMMAMKLGPSLFLNGLAVLTCRYSRSIRQWAASLLIQTQFIHLKATDTRRQAPHDSNPAPSEEPAKTRTQSRGRRGSAAAGRRATLEE